MHARARTRAQDVNACTHTEPRERRIPHTRGLEAIAVGATVWDVSGPTPTEAVKPPPPLPNVLGEVRLHIRMREKI